MTSAPLLAIVAALPYIAAAQPAANWKAEVDQVLDTLSASIAAENARFPGPAEPADKAWVIQKLQHMVDVDQLGRNAMTGRVSRVGARRRALISVSASPPA